MYIECIRIEAESTGTSDEEVGIGELLTVNLIGEQH